METSKLKRLRRWLGRIALVVLGLLVVSTAVGTIWEMTSRHRVAAEFPPPGRLVDIGGRRMRLDCRGSGTPIVVFEAGLDMNGGLAWSAVHDTIAEFTRACAYDRAGIMWSDASPRPRNAGSVAEELHATLDRGHEAGPYVMVGHSLGGPYIMAFTKRYASEVAGLVFVDASHPDQVERFAAVIGKNPDPSEAALKAAAALAWTGLPRLLWPKDGDPHMPADAAAASRAYAPTSLTAVLGESESLADSFKDAGTFRTLGDRPVAVLTGMKPMPPEALAALKITRQQANEFQKAWLAMHDEEASWSTRSTHQQFADASHYIQFDRPDAVVAAVREVVGKLRETPATTAPTPSAN